MAIRSKLELEKLVKIGAEFGLEVVSSKPVKEGLRNSNYVLETTDEQKYILRVCDDQSSRQAEILARLIDYLSKNGFPSPKTIFPNGQRVVIYEDKPIIMLSYIDGETVPDLNRSQLEQLGECMARLHDLPVPAFLSLHHPFGFEAYQERFSKVDHDYIRWFCERKRYFDQAIPGDLPKGIVHGDLWFDNAIYRDGNLVGIIDFESGFHGDCIFDLSQTAIGACRDNGSLKPEKIRALIAGYEMVRLLQSKEKELLKTVASYAAAVISIWRFDYFNVRNDEPNHQKYFEAVKLSNGLHALPNDRFMKAVFGDS